MQGENAKNSDNIYDSLSKKKKTFGNNEEHLDWNCLLRTTL